MDFFICNQLLRWLTTDDGAFPTKIWGKTPQTQEKRKSGVGKGKENSVHLKWYPVMQAQGNRSTEPFVCSAKVALDAYEYSGRIEWMTVHLLCLWGHGIRNHISKGTSFPYKGTTGK
eukprot:TRINITY_DN786_c1_g1_i1.p1 TRINITY_DN786_c1_g1~~TRINITY_DN786_c1_g1_i1.p1  ORF type:complete len:117 (-),score=15.61 TRINITY_DN786_c1_g1_i1:99-449(-)